ncbi:MAG TPA: DUF3987 domain-containing protein [Prolixibacteraceae bacterium]|jgi:hypothetical protein
MKHKFNPHDWLPTNEGAEPQPTNHQSANPPIIQPSNHRTIQSSNPPGSNISTDIDLVISRIESAQTDLTASYSDWLNIGFALADELGEGGRDYFHRISRFYHRYSLTDCNKQYDQCLGSKGHGITIKTLFHLAKQAGVGAAVFNRNLESDDSTGAAVFNRNLESDNITGAAVFNRNLESDDSMGAAVFNRNLNHEPENEDGKNENRERGMEQDAVKNRSSLPTLPDEIFPTLPEFLQRVVDRAESNEERDILLLGALGALSACLHKLSGIYDGNQVYPNLYLFITAQASAGKGRLNHCKRLVLPIHWELRKQTHLLKQDYEMALREYNLQKSKGGDLDKPVKPPELMLIIPANSSATGFFQLLAENKGSGLIFETEGDTLAQALKSDYGNYSDGLRKGAHHEMISYSRRADREYVEIEEPCISAVMSGTPKQVCAVIPNAENGLFSRFIFYHMNIRPFWKDVFSANKNKGLKEYFNSLGQEFFTLYKALNENPDIEFRLSEEQQIQFNAFFTQIQERYLMLQGMDYMATIRRLGLIAFRLGMIFTALRINETGDFSERQFCSEADFQSVLSMIRILVRHSSHVFSELPVDIQTARPKDKKEQFLDQLPEKFTHQEFIDLAKSMAIPERSAELFISTFCNKGWVIRERKGFYIKPPNV